MKGFLLAIALAASLACRAAIVETKRWVAVKARDSWGHEFTRDVMVTVFHEDSVDGPRPLALLNHGRGNAQERKSLGRAAYTANSRWLVKHGFIVAVPTRIGYGVTGGPDIEDSGGCVNADYQAAYAAGTAQALAVLDYMRTWKEVDPQRVLVLGQSFGGTIAVAIASMNVPGVTGAINFAGGGGGRPRSHPGDPCSPQAMKRLFAQYGKTARIPTLWIYSENDEYFAASLTREWFDAFRAAGGNGEYLALPAYPGGGHGAFTKAPQGWQPRVEPFLRAFSGDRDRADPRRAANPRATSD